MIKACNKYYIDYWSNKYKIEIILKYIYFHYYKSEANRNK